MQNVPEATLFFYTIYGCTIRSAYQLPYPTVEPVSDADVVIQDGIVPETLGPDAFRFGLWMAQGKQFLFEEKSVARMMVRDGREIVVQRHPQAQARNVSVYLNGSAMAALLQQRGLLPLHASAVETPLGAVLFAGASGAGKSTISAMMQEQGYSALTDDICALHLDAAGQPVLEPSFANLRLWKRMADDLNFDITDKQVASSNFQKYEFPVPYRCADPVPLKKIFYLHAVEQPSISIENLDKASAFHALRNIGYRRRFHIGMGLQDQYFKLVSACSTQIPVAKVLRPSHSENPRALAEAIINDLNLSLPDQTICTPCRP